MMVSITEITNCSFGTLVFGNDCCTLDENQYVFDIVQQCILMILADSDEPSDSFSWVKSGRERPGCKRVALNDGQGIVRAMSE